MDDSRRDPCLLFLIAETPTKLVGIVPAIEPEKRIQTLRTANAARLCLVAKKSFASVMDLRVEEGRVVRELRELDLHIRGMWFRADGRLWDVVKVPAPPEPTEEEFKIESFLSLLEKEMPKASEPPPKLITLQELATLWKVSPRTIQRRVKDGSLPYYRVGNQIRFLYSDAEKARKGFD